MVLKAHHKVKKNLIKIYTKTGDKGQTGLYGGKRILKSSLRIDALGTVDELNSLIGRAVAELEQNKEKMPSLKKELEKIPHDLYEVGALLAIPKNTHVTKGQLMHKKVPGYLNKRVTEIEKYIDGVAEHLPLLIAFILPGGGRVGASLHHARTVCRRAERRIVEIAQSEYVPPDVLVYMNRLSDALFTMARYANLKDKHKEILWDKRGSV